MIDVIKTQTAVVLSDKKFGLINRQSEAQRLSAAVEAAFKHYSNRDKTRSQIEAELRQKSEFKPADLKHEARMQLQRREREVRAVVSAATARSKRLRLPEVPPVTLSEDQASADPGARAVIRVMKGVERQLQKGETRSEFMAVKPVVGVERIASRVARMTAIKSELALPFSDRWSSGSLESGLTESQKDQAFKAWKLENSRRESLRDELDNLMASVAVGCETLLERKPDLDGLEPVAILKLQAEYASIHGQLNAIVAPVIAERVAEADAIDAAASELEAAWSGGAGSVGIALVLRTIAHVGEPLQTATPAERFLDSTEQAAKVIGAIKEATDPAKVMDRAIDARLDAREPA